MAHRARFLWVGIFALSFSVARAQSPLQIIQQAVNTEHAADQNDHSQWIYLEQIRTPKEQVVQWVAGAGQGNVQRILEKDGQGLSDAEQRKLVQGFLHDPRAQRKQVEEINHDNRQIDDLLRLLPVAFLWTETDAGPATTSLHFEPAPRFHPPTREARVFSSMTGDLVVDNQQHRICSMSGRLIHDVTFGGGIIGRLKAGSTFSLEQKQVGPFLWQLTAFHIHLQGNAILFKTVSLEQDDLRSGFKPESATVTLDQAADAVMSQPEAVQAQAR